MDDISLLDGEPLQRWQRAFGIMPRNGLGIVRRAVGLALLTWLPVAVWAWFKRRALPGDITEPLLAHYGVHVRCLVAIPLFIVAEGTVQAMTHRLLTQFVRRGILADTPALEAVVDSVRRLRGRALPWVIIGIATLLLALTPTMHPMHELLWADGVERPGSFGFGGWWYLYVSRPAYIALGLAWLWRLLLLTILLRRLAAQELSLVPTHPDGFGGLGFLASLPVAFVPVILGLSAVISSGWAHQVVYHQVELVQLRIPAAVFLLLVLVLFLSPTMAFTSTLARTRRVGIEDYGALVARHGRVVRERWVRGREVTDEILSAPEIGPVADTLTLYEAVVRMRPVLVTRQSFVAILVAAAFPILVVISLKIPVAQMVGQVLKALS